MLSSSCCARRYALLTENAVCATHTARSDQLIWCVSRIFLVLVGFVRDHKYFFLYQCACAPLVDTRLLFLSARSSLCTLYFFTRSTRNFYFDSLFCTHCVLRVCCVCLCLWAHAVCVLGRHRFSHRLLCCIVSLLTRRSFLAGQRVCERARALVHSTGTLQV